HRPMTKIRQRQSTRTAYGELDDIVVQLFDDLAGEETSLRQARSPMRAAQRQRNPRRENDRPRTGARAETMPRHDVTRRPAQSDASTSQPDGPPPRSQASDDFDVEGLFAGESLHEENADAFSPEEEKYIRDVAQWLAPRPNADLLLDLLAETL